MSAVYDVQSTNAPDSSSSRQPPGPMRECARTYVGRHTRAGAPPGPIDPLKQGSTSTVVKRSVETIWRLIVRTGGVFDYSQTIKGILEAHDKWDDNVDITSYTDIDRFIL